MTCDPFFSTGPDPFWNACIGQQGSEEAYVDGFIEAAVELITNLFEKRQLEKRDTLVFPILYNARHAIELALKMAIGDLAKLGVFGEQPRKNHDLLAHLDHLLGERIGDELLVQILEELKPFVVSLSKIDSDGQGLRYHEAQDGTQSLGEHAITSLIVIRESLFLLQAVLKRMKQRLNELRYERVGGFYTPDLSRRDLLEIAKELPAFSDWTKPQFDEARVRLRKRYKISSRQFSDGLDLIKENRETRSLIGLETSLKSLSDRKCQFLTIKHAELYPQKARQPASRIMKGEEIYALLKKGDGKERKIYEEISNELDLADIADTHVIFYLGRDGELPETYEMQHREMCTRLDNTGELSETLDHVFSKVNFREGFIKGLRMVGKVTLAKELADIACES